MMSDDAVSRRWGETLPRQLKGIRARKALLFRR